MQQTLELKQDGETLTGAILERHNQRTEIKDGTIKNNELSFSVVRERNGRQFKAACKGRLDGDTIRGTIVDTTAAGQTRSREWMAKRVR